MIIHRVALGETVHSIAKKYSIPVIKLIGDNELSDGRLAVGEELIIIKPTREAPVLLGDSVSKLALRFGVRKNSLYCLNPWIAGEEYLRPGQMLTVKASPPTHGTANALGIARKETQKRKFKAALPFLTYIAFMEYKLCESGLVRVASLSDMKELGKRHSRTVLLGIELDAALRYMGEELIEEMTELARCEGQDGIYLKINHVGCDKSELTKFLLALKRHLLGKNLILFCEAEDKKYKEAIEISDAATLKTRELAANGDTQAGLIEFSQESEGSKCFLFPSYLASTSGEGDIYISDALRIARRTNKEITSCGESELLGFSYNKFKGGVANKVTVSFPSLTKVKEELRLAKELGFGGFAFDIEATPISYFCIFNSLFSRADYISLFGENY